MKRIATAAFALCLMSGTSALAQDNDHHDKNAGPHGAASGGPKGGPSGPTPQVHTIQTGPQGGLGHPSGAPSGFTPQNRTYHSNGQTQGSSNHWNGGAQGSSNRWVGAPQGSNNRSTGPQGFTGRQVGGPNGYRPGFGAPGYRPGGTRPHYNPQYFPRTFNLGARFHWRGGSWSGPQGFYYRRWSYGQILPFGWFASQWWINDYYYYDLPVPPYGYEWIRNGPDALLVDINSGEVVEVVPSVFY